MTIQHMKALIMGDVKAVVIPRFWLDSKMLLSPSSPVPGKNASTFQSALYNAQRNHGVHFTPTLWSKISAACALSCVINYGYTRYPDGI